MGQKINPVGFRLNITQKHKSIWFRKLNSYALFLEQDAKLRRFINENYSNAGITTIEIERTYKNSIFLRIYAAKPAVIMNSSEFGLLNLSKNLKNIINQKNSVNVELFQVSEPNEHSILLARFISDQLIRRVAFRRIIRKAIKRARSTTGVKGIKIQISGRLNGAEIARSQWTKKGRMPLQTLRADIDYSHEYAKTIYGILGIKVWLFKGERISKRN